MFDGRAILNLTASFVLLGIAACLPSAAPTPTPAKTVPAAAPTVAAQATKPPAAAPTPAPTPTTAPRPASLKFGTTGGLGVAAFYVGYDKGHFKEQGIDMELVTVRTVGEIIAPLGTGQVDVGATPLSTALLAAADRGVDLKIVADGGQSMPQWEYAWILLRKDLADSGRVKTAADLKGMKVAIPSQGGLGDQTVQALLEEGGLKAGEAEVVVLPFAEQAAAFGNKAIAAGFAVDPFIARGLQEGFSVKWLPVSKFFGGRVQSTTMVYGAGIARDQDLARRWMVAYLKGVRDYLKGFTSKEARQDVVNILVKYTGISDPKLYDLMEPPYFDPNGLADKKSMEAQYKWWVEKGLYTGKKTFAEMMDLSFAEYAAQRLGRQ